MAWCAFSGPATGLTLTHSSPALPRFGCVRSPCLSLFFNKKVVHVHCVSIQLVANPVFIPCESIHTRHFRERKPNKMSSLVPGVMAIMVSVASKNNVLSGFICEHGDTMLHLAVCAHCSRTAFHSVRLDEWATIRERPPPSGRRERIFRSRRRAAKVTALIGAGYTPRIVFLAGMMLRSLQVRPLCVGILASASFWRTRGQPL